MRGCAKCHRKSGDARGQASGRGLGTSVLGTGEQIAMTQPVLQNNPPPRAPPHHLPGDPRASTSCSLTGKARDVQTCIELPARSLLEDISQAAQASPVQTSNLHALSCLTLSKSKWVQLSPQFYRLENGGSGRLSFPRLPSQRLRG